MSIVKNKNKTVLLLAIIALIVAVVVTQICEPMKSYATVLTRPNGVPIQNDPQGYGEVGVYKYVGNDGKTRSAYCCQHQLASVPTGTDIEETPWPTTSWGADMMKALYYGYIGPKRWEGFGTDGSNSAAYALTSLLLDTYYPRGSGKDYSNTTAQHNGKTYKFSDFKAFVDAQPPVPANPSICKLDTDKIELKPVKRASDGKTVLRSQDIYVMGTSGEYISVTPPPGAELVRTKGYTIGEVNPGLPNKLPDGTPIYEGTVTRDTGTARIFADDTIYFETTDLQADWSEWAAQPIGTELKLIFQAFEHDTRQTLVGFDVEEVPFTLGLEPTSQAVLTKVSTVPDTTDGNACYTLQGAEFEVWGDVEVEDTDGNGNVTGSHTEYMCITTITTDANGEATLSLPDGDYDFKEVTAPTGYAKVEDIAVTVAGDTEIEVPEEPIQDPVRLIVGKIDKETTEKAKQAGATFEDAQFKVSYYDGYYTTPEQAKASGTPTREWIFKTDVNGEANYDEEHKVSGDPLYHDSAGNLRVPLGTLVIDEIKAPKGYFMDDKVEVRQITEDGTDRKDVYTYNPPDGATGFSEQIYRGDLELIKIADGSQKRLANVPFTITSKTTGEVHTIVTDDNGYASTKSNWIAGAGDPDSDSPAIAEGLIDADHGWNPHGRNTNQGLTSEDGIWFGLMDVLREDKGALMYDTYIIDEQPCESNKEYELLTGIEVRIYKDNTIVLMGNLTNDKPNGDVEIKTTAFEKQTEDKKILATGEITIVDVVEYKGVTPDKEYTVKGVLMDKETEQPLLIDGEQVTSEKTFTPKNQHGYVEVEFTFDATGLGGKDIVVFEDLLEEGVSVATHAEIEDRDQTVRILGPEMKTTALDSETKTHVSCADEEVTIIDTIEYKELAKHQEYRVKTTLVDKATGEPLKNANGEIISEEKTFSNIGSGTFDVPITFDARGCEGKTIVVFEEIFWEGQSVAQHNDIEDTDQTIYFPEIKTKAYGETVDENGNVTRGNTIIPEEKTSIVDTVSFSNLEVGKEYILTGTLMDKATGKPLETENGTVTTSAKFTPNTPSGTTEIKFTFNASTTGGKSIVVFEQLYSGEYMIAKHEDINDADQTVTSNLGRIVMDDESKLGKGRNVKTGDNGMGMAWIAIYALVLSMGVAMSLAMFRRKKHNIK